MALTLLRLAPQLQVAVEAVPVVAATGRVAVVVAVQGNSSPAHLLVDQEPRAKGTMVDRVLAVALVAVVQEPSEPASVQQALMALAELESHQASVEAA